MNDCSEEIKIDIKNGPKKPIANIKDPKSAHFSQFKYFMHLLKTEGPLTFYKGLTSGLIGVVLSFGIYFWWYRFFKNFYYTVLHRTS